LPNIVTTIDIGTFKECINLKHITLPDNVSNILELAFYDTESMTNITISKDSKLEKISPYAFGNNGLEIIVLPEKFIVLDSYVFDNCKNLKSVRFLAPELDYIYDFAFNGCIQLENIYIYNIKDMSNYYKWVS
jgi:hypothetical protein